ncbi:efflux RND transporter periplasmic adaptor subunit [Duganella sp. FT92W]|uniref:Efflux RND transporter periplasmic adaptor subunit n=1 Tax=Pseudoduganella rivuli TaxID=2666085 RepID=A0A7X2IRF2_9BURK|nr:efflux RND transporter periplasmic adaptor subunit [Pseudoduganella rivuli]MRV74407.1 efflux RND transporter periplasmic adaptor subunit [Pseudoduganella rivuli]
MTIIRERARTKGGRKVLAVAAVAAAVGAAGWYWAGGSQAPGRLKDATAAGAQDGARAGGKGEPQGAREGGGRRGGPGAGGPPLVRLAAAQQQDVAVEIQANGTVVPLSTVEIRPQVSRVVRQVHVKEGQNVAAGALLFTLDNRAEQAALDQAQARLVRSEATLADTERQAARSRELAVQKFISASAADSLQAQAEAARAQVQADRAALRSAQVDLGHTVLRAPSSGRIGVINVYPGSMAQASAALVTVTQMHPIAVSFTVPESGLPGLLDGQKAGGARVSATVPSSGPGQEAHSYAGRLSFIDSAVDAQAGTIRVKAQFANNASQLWPGQFVQAKVTLDNLRAAVVVPLAAIVTSGNGARVFTVDGEQQAQSRPVKVLHAFGGKAAVAGIEAGEQVIVEGKQNLRPGVKVRIDKGGNDSRATLAALGGAA